MKKSFVLLMFALLVLALAACEVPNPVNPGGLAENPASDFQYEISPDGKSVYINKYIGTSEDVVIPSKIDDLPVTTLRGIPYGEEPYIGLLEGAFENCPIKTVVIPATVEIISNDAFKNCSELTSVTISENSQLGGYLWWGAFQDCKKLEKIDLSFTKITKIDSFAFAGCTALTEIRLPDSLLEIGSCAFSECSALLEIELPKNLMKIEGEAFGYCSSLKKITVPAQLDLRAVDSAIFHNTPSLEKIIFEEGREELSGYSFFGIPAEANVEIEVPKSVKRFSLSPFSVSGKVKFVFLGDCPELVKGSGGSQGYYKELPTMCYDASRNGWDTCEWIKQFPHEPVK